MSSNTNFPESHQSKAEQQRQYRGKEGEGFAELQQAIREVTEGKVDLAKRHETLTQGMSVHYVDIQLPNPHSSRTEN
jgi:hypothetical protein